MNKEDDLTWRLPLVNRWNYVRPRRLGPVLEWWELMLLGGPVPVVIALLMALAILWMKGN